MGKQKSERKQNSLPDRLPKMIVFDLDYTLWPEWIDCTYGPPYQYDAETNRLENKYGEILGLFKHIPEVFTIIKSMPDTKIAIASRTGAPDWAMKALKMLRINDTVMKDWIDHFEIYPSSKIRHFTALQAKSGIPCNQMVFFDDEWRNREVETLGVHFCHVNSRDGVTLDLFYNALHKFAQQSRLIQTKLTFE